jgi:hypothetical protein
MMGLNVDAAAPSPSPRSTILLNHRTILIAVLTYLATTDVIWIRYDTRPPFWDMAYHSISALRIYDAFGQKGLRAIWRIPSLTGFYPPLFQTAIAAAWAVFGRTIAVSRFVNLAAVAILLAATYGIGKRILSPFAAVAAAAIASSYPLMLWLSREILIDYSLSAMVALSMWALLRTNEFSDRKRSVIFGLICGLGMLTKWTFPFFVMGPAVWLARRNWRNAALSIIVAAGIAGYWYVPEGASLHEFFKINSAGGIIESDPRLISWQAVIFYIRALEGYQLFLPLFVLFLIGGVLLARRFNPAWLPIILWIVGGWAGMMLFQNKDPRYTAPLLPAIALITAITVDRKPVILYPLLAFLMFQHVLVSFGMKSLPETIVLAQGARGSDPWNWNLYTQEYEGLWGRPAREDWKIDDVLDRITPGTNTPVRLGIVPDIPRFDSLAFEFDIAFRRKTVTINRLWRYDEAFVRRNDYILISEADQGFAKFFAPDADKVSHYVMSDPQTFHVVESFTLPSGQTIRLYKVIKDGRL